MICFNFFSESRIISINEFSIKRVIASVNVLIFYFIQVRKIRFAIISFDIFKSFSPLVFL